MSNQINPFEWVEALFKLALGFFLGLAIGYGIKLFTEVNFWVALGVCLGGVLFYYGLIGLHRLSDGVFNKLFPSWALPPPRSPGNQKSPLLISRFGVLIGILVGVLAVFIFPEAWLQAIL